MTHRPRVAPCFASSKYVAAFHSMDLIGNKLFQIINYLLIILTSVRDSLSCTRLYYSIFLREFRIVSGILIDEFRFVLNGLVY